VERVFGYIYVAAELPDTKRVHCNFYAVHKGSLSLGQSAPEVTVVIHVLQPIACGDKEVLEDVNFTRDAYVLQ
jgi:hypothetical protein